MSGGHLWTLRDRVFQIGGTSIQSLQLYPGSQVRRLAGSGSVSLHEDIDFQAQPGCMCPHLDLVAFPLLFSMGPTELPPQSQIQKHNGFM